MDTLAAERKTGSNGNGPSGRGRPTWGFLQGVLPLAPGRVGPDLLAGVTLAALAIPEVMGYARIAGMPVVSGLYTLLVPAVLFALFGSSRHLVVGADSATAAIMAATLATLVQPASAGWMQLAGVLALLTAVLLLAARIARLSFLADFLSRTVLAGFLTGVGIQVALGELPGLLGLQAPGSTAVSKAWFALTQLAHASVPNAAIGVGVVLGVVLLRKIAPRLPAPLIAIVVALALTSGLHLHDRGVQVVGALRGGLPPWTLPDASLAWAHMEQLLPSAVSMAIVILAQSAATARAYAWKYDEALSEDQDLVALALANAGAALTGAFVVNGSPTKTQMVDSAGGRSQLAHLAMAAVVLVVLLFLSAPIANLPTAALAAVVFLIGVELVQIGELRRVRRARPSEFWIAIAAAIAVVVVGVERAIIFAMALSLVDHVRRGYRPHNSLIVRGEDGHARLSSIEGSQEYAPGLIVYRFNHSMYYANIEVLSREVTTLVAGASDPVRWFVIDMDAVDDVDFSAGEALLSLHKSLASSGVALKFLRCRQGVADQLRKYGIPGAAATDILASVRDMRHRFEQAHPQ